MLLRAETSYKFALCNFIALIAASGQDDRREYRVKSLRLSFYSTRLLLLLFSILCLAPTGCIAGEVNGSDLETSATLISQTGTGSTPAVSSFYCSSSAITGAGTDTCTVKLNGSSATGAQSVTLSSNNAAVTVPASVTVPANATSAQFAATVSSVVTTQTVTLTASDGGVSINAALQLNANKPTLTISTASLAFNNVVVNSPSTQSVTLTSTGTEPLTISAASLTGAGFTVSGATFPLTLNPAQTAVLGVQFDPAAAGAVTGQLIITSNSYPTASTSISLTGTGWIPAVSSFYCSSSAITGAGTDTCTVKLNGSSATGAQSVTLSSNNAAVTVPASVTVPANATSAQFAATVSSVVTTQTVTLTASDGGVSINAALQLNANKPTLTISTASLAFNNVVVNSPSTQSVTLTSTGTEPLTISAASLTGAGFTVSGATFPLTLNPAQTAVLGVQFDPAAAGAVTGQLIITSNSYPTASTSISLTGTGWIPAVSSFYCSSSAITGAGTDICTVKLNGSSATSAQSVAVSSNNAAVTVPASVIVPANATSAQFTATVSSLLTTQTVTLTASVGGVSINASLQLNAYILTLTANRTGIAFQDVLVKTAQTQSVTLTSTGTEPVTINASALTGSGFTISVPVLPLTLNPGQTSTLVVNFLPTAAGVSTGQIIVTSNSSINGTVVISLSGGAVIGPKGAALKLGSFAYNGSPIVSTLAQANSSVALSGDFFGMTIVNLTPNSLESQPNMTPFPSFPVSALRFWDVDYWAMIDAYEGENNWTKMDNTVAIAQQNGVSDFIFTFGRVPAWASTNPTDPCTNGEGPGTCSAPNMDALDAFAAQVVQRYCGTVKYYETWNEPDNPQFWDGTNAQLLTIAQNVYQIVKDPANCGCTNGSCSPNGGINPNQVLTPSISGVGTAQIGWLNSYLTAAGAPYSYADIATFHGYQSPGSQPETIVSGVQLLQQTLATYGLSDLPLWNTEADWKSNTSFDQDQQASWLIRYHAIQAALGVSRFVWYSYDNCGWGTLFSSPLCATLYQTTVEGTPGQLTEAGTAYSTIENWFIGANFAQCLQYENGLWACELQRSGGYDAWMLWSSTGANISIQVPENLTVYRDWQNNLNPLPGQLTVDQMPVLLENQDL